MRKFLLFLKLWLCLLQRMLLPCSLYPLPFFCKLWVKYWQLYKKLVRWPYHFFSPFTYLGSSTQTVYLLWCSYLLPHCLVPVCFLSQQHLNTVFWVFPTFLLPEGWGGGSFWFRMYVVFVKICRLSSLSWDSDEHPIAGFVLPSWGWGHPPNL